MATAVTFDFTSPDMAGPQFWDATREVQRRGPLVWIDSLGGYWAATSFDMVLRIAQDWQTFSSAEGVALRRVSFDDMPHIMPIEYDPPRQRMYRKQVNPFLTPSKVTVYEDAIRGVSDELIDTFISGGSCDLMSDFARKFPGTVFFRLIVHSTDEEFRVVEPAARVLTFDPDPKKKPIAAADLRAWAGRVFASREGMPAIDDVSNAVMHLRDVDPTCGDNDLLSGLQILAQGGIGTSASTIGATMRILCEHPDLQERVRNDLELLSPVIEESLRLEPPLPLDFRTVARDVELGGQQLRKGDKVCMMLGAANRDPAVFERPDEVDIDRPHNRHITFGAGVHRCIGSNLARLQIRVAMEQLVTRLAPFRIPEGAELEYSSLQARGLWSMPLEFAGSPNKSSEPGPERPRRDAAESGEEASGHEPGTPASSEPGPERPRRDAAESGEEASGREPGTPASSEPGPERPRRDAAESGE